MEKGLERDLPSVFLNLRRVRGEGEGQDADGAGAGSFSSTRSADLMCKCAERLIRTMMLLCPAINNDSLVSACLAAPFRVAMQADTELTLLMKLGMARALLRDHMRYKQHMHSSCSCVLCCAVLCCAVLMLAYLDSIIG